MGYLPIFLYLASFIFLFILVVNNSIKSKRKQYQAALDDLAVRLQGHAEKAAGRNIGATATTIEQAEQQYQQLKASANPGEPQEVASLNQLKFALGRVRQQQYWYNNMVKTKPYSFVAQLFGRGTI
jgi:hypothetical protein